jgi:hypothetical protein
MHFPSGTSYEYVSGVFHVNPPETALSTELTVFFWNRGESEATVSALLYRYNDFLTEIGPFAVEPGKLFSEGLVDEVDSPGFNDPSPYYWARLFASSVEVVPSMRFSTPTDFWGPTPPPNPPVQQLFVSPRDFAVFEFPTPLRPPIGPAK